jgi:hypothetical protein
MNTTKQNSKSNKVINATKKESKIEILNKVTFLAENVKGKDLLKLKLQANKDNKSELQSLSFCLNQFKKHGNEMINGFNNISMEEITPKNILPFLTDKEKERQILNNNKFTFYLIENLVIRYVKNKYSK